MKVNWFKSNFLGSITEKMKARYPLIAYLDKGLSQEVRSIHWQLCDLTGSRGCLDAWEPHISVGSEVWLEEDEVDAYVRDLYFAVVGMRPFSVTLKGFGFIDNWSGGKLPGNTPYGVFLKVIVNPELERLAEVLRPISTQRKTYFEMPWPYRPHVAIAYKDLSDHGYGLAKEL